MNLLTHLTAAAALVLCTAQFNQAQGTASECINGLTNVKFDCADKNPCVPSLSCPVDTKYPGVWRSWYVQCTAEGDCSETKCDKLHVFDVVSQDCIPKDESVYWGRSDDGLGDSTVEFKNRCARDAFNCLKRNPCFPTQCTTDVDIYNGIGPSHYVTCNGLACQEEFCPEGETYDEVNSRCTGSDVPADCEWQEINVEAPVSADCSTDYAFFHSVYSDQERGLRHLDGFVDCAAAPGENQYYVEEFELPSFTMIASCLPGFSAACFTLTSPQFDGFFYTFFSIRDESGDLYTYDDRYRNLNNEVPDDCVEHNYFDEAPIVFSNRPYPECYSQGGRLFYLRKATHFGSCSEKVPCSYTPSETTKIYKSVCV